MATAKQQERRERIEEAAYAVLNEAGYKGASLLTIAKRASASNETLYRWYGSKPALFGALIEENARQSKRRLEEALRLGQDPIETLAALGPVLLAMVTGERAVALNRAAAGDAKDTGTLGPAIARLGRDMIAPLVASVIARAARAGRLACGDPAEAAELYFSLLIGDLQVRRVIGAIPPLTQDEIEARAQLALDRFRRLHEPGPILSRNPEPSR